jgi:hypothetical protein
MATLSSSRSRTSTHSVPWRPGGVEPLRPFKRAKVVVSNFCLRLTNGNPVPVGRMCTRKRGETQVSLVLMQAVGMKQWTIGVCRDVPNLGTELGAMTSPGTSLTGSAYHC